MIQFLLNYISWSKFNLANIFHSPDLIIVPLFVIPQLVFIDGNKHILIFFIWLPVFILLRLWKFCSLILVPQVVTFITVTFWHNFSSYIVSNDLLITMNDDTVSIIWHPHTSVSSSDFCFYFTWFYNINMISFSI